MSSLIARRGTPRIQLTPKQSNIYVHGWQEDARFRTAVCGRRFGKTFLGVEEIKRAYRLAVERNVDQDNEIWYGAPTFKQAKRVFWNRLKRYMPPGWIAGRPNNSECVLPMVGGYVIRIVGLDDPDALRGSGLWFFLGDEWDDAKDVIWPEIVRPMLATAHGHALTIGTPKGFRKLHAGYVAGLSGEDKDPERKSWKYNTLEGGNVPVEEVDAARRVLDAKTFRQEYEASFETYQGIIYHSFDRQKNIQPPPWKTQYASNKPNVSPYYNPNLPVHVGLDFNIDPMTAHVFQETVEGPPGGRHVVSWQIDEIHIFSSNTHEMGSEIATRYGKPGFSGDTELKHITIYPDPSGAGRRTAAHGYTDISILRKMGFSVYAMSNHPLVRDRINIVNGKYCAADGTRSLFIAPNCPQSVDAAEKHVYKEGTSEPDKGGDPDYSHDNDAHGYYVYTRFAHQKATPAHVGHMGR